MNAGLHIRLAGAGKRYNRDWIFKACDLLIPAGSHWAITGANGSGKSTLLQCISGYQSLSAGSRTYTLGDVALAEDKLFQHLSLAAPYLDLPELYTLRELLAFHFEMKPLHPSFSTATWLEEAGLTAHLDKQIQYFSSGMKQRVKLILAVGADTPLLLLDEPTTNLDAQGIAWYQDLVQAEAGGRTILVASNQQHEYAFCTDQIQISTYKV